MKQIGYSRFAYPAECQTCQRNAELRRGDITVEVFKGTANRNRPFITILRQLFNTCAAGTDQRKFSGDKKAIRQYQAQDSKHFQKRKHLFPSCMSNLPMREASITHPLW